MATTKVAPARPPTRAPRVTRRRAPAPRPAVAAGAAVVASAGLVAVLALGLADEAAADLHARAGGLLLLGGLTGLAGMYLALVQVLLISRIPVLERTLGQDGLVRIHRRLGPWPISLLVAHAVLLTVAFAMAAKTGLLHQLGAFLSTYPDMLAATVALGLMVAAGVTSARALRSRMRRESWWVLHLYMYLALALSFAHVIALGPTFVGHTAVRVLWSAVWAGTAGVVLAYRVGLPVVRSLRHRVRVQEVRREGPGVVSVICQGRRLDRLPLSGGQFLQWRFIARGLWWQAHPYSVSALPDRSHLRCTVRQIGDHSRAVARLRPGTRVWIEGPYGAVTPEARVHRKVVLFAGGIGVTALRSLLEDLPRGSDPVVLLRAPSEEQLVLRDEVAALVRRLKGTLHELVGPRSEVGDARQILRRLVPDIATRDVFVCGPEGFVHHAVAAARSLGVHSDAVHYEVFSW